jgi:hypothetical protein
MIDAIKMTQQLVALELVDEGVTAEHTLDRLVKMLVCVLVCVVGVCVRVCVFKTMRTSWDQTHPSCQ